MLQIVSRLHDESVRDDYQNVVAVSRC
jgi:hypothetical protein